MDSNADIVVHAQTIRTLDPDNPIVDSIAIKDGRILAVGASALRLQEDARATVDLGANVIVPGFIEPHTHPDLCAQMYSWVDISGFTWHSAEEVMHALRECVHRFEPGDWIFVFGYDPVLYDDLLGLSLAELDEISPYNPIAVMTQSMHTLYVNSLALDTAGITNESEPPRFGGEYVKNALGELTGKIEEAPAMRPFLRFFDDSLQVRSLNLSQQYERYRGAGITMIGSAGLFFRDSDTADLYRNLASDSNCKIRNAVYLRHMDLANNVLEPFLANGRFGFNGVKLWYDGSPYTGTMLLDSPYLETKLTTSGLAIPSGSTGRSNWDIDDFGALVNELHEAGIQILVHAQGDRATREVLDAFEQTLSRSNRREHRHRIEHCALIEPGEVERAARLGVSISFHMNHVKYYGDRLRDDIIGSDRINQLMLAASAISHGIRISLHADSPMFPANPLDLMQTAVTRESITGIKINESEKIGREEALRAVTSDAAWQLGFDHEVGTIEVGKLADLTVLSEDPIEVSENQINQITVVDTRVSGRSTAN